MTIDGRFFAAATAVISGAALVTLGVVGGVTNRLTPREVIGGCIALLVGATAALWLRRESRQHGGRHRS